MWRFVSFIIGLQDSRSGWDQNQWPVRLDFGICTAWWRLPHNPAPEASRALRRHLYPIRGGGAIRCGKPDTLVLVVGFGRTGVGFKVWEWSDKGVVLAFRYQGWVGLTSGLGR